MQAIKDKYVNRMKTHIEADELVRGVGYNEGKRCAVGCTLNKIKKPFMIFILESLFDKFDNEKFPEVTESIKQVIKFHETEFDSESARSAVQAARIATWLEVIKFHETEFDSESARSAAESAAKLAWSAFRAARIATWLAVESAVVPVELVVVAVKSAAESAESAGSGAYDKFADKLIELIKECK